MPKTGRSGRSVPTKLSFVLGQYTIFSHNLNCQIASIDSIDAPLLTVGSTLCDARSATPLAMPGMLCLLNTLHVVSLCKVFFEIVDFVEVISPRKMCGIQTILLGPVYRIHLFPFHLSSSATSGIQPASVVMDTTCRPAIPTKH